MVKVLSKYMKENVNTTNDLGMLTNMCRHLSKHENICIDHGKLSDNSSMRYKANNLLYVLDFVLCTRYVVLLKYRTQFVYYTK